MDALLPLFPGFEVRNGTMLRQHNELIEAIVGERRSAGMAAVAVGGSDAHTLAGVGTTYTEAPGRNREEFLDNVRAGLTRVGGRHGTTLRVTREIYGVIARYWASLVGAGRQELTWGRRAIGIGFSLVSFPAEFVPLLIAVNSKVGEARRVGGYRRQAGPVDGRGQDTVSVSVERARS